MQPLRKLKTAAKSILGFRLPNRAIDEVEEPLLVVIFLRGGADGLSIVAPFGDDGYYRNRCLTGIPSPSSGSSKKLIDLDGLFGLHPALAPIHPLYTGGELSFVHACGSGDRTLSHFAASNTVERGHFAGEGESTGWLARFLQLSGQKSSSPARAVAIGSLLPASLGGAACAMALQNVHDLLIKSPFPGGDASVQRSLRSLYNDKDLISDAGRRTLDLIDLLRRAQMPGAAHNRDYTSDDFGDGIQQIAALVKSDVGLSVACIDQTGYDTHVLQGAEEGNLANCLSILARNIQAFVQDIGKANWKRTKVIVMSEFGRRVRENDGQGTDHGHGGVVMVLGGSQISGGSVRGLWPGLDGDGIDDNGNLKATTDYRNVLLEVLASQAGFASARTVFPDLTYRPVGVVNG